MIERIWKLILRRRTLSLLAIPAALLWIVSLFYRLLFLIYRATRPAPKKLNVPVISVGNITVGGTGKTPMVRLVASGLLSEGLRVGVVSSGYGRDETSPVLSEGYRLAEVDAARVGDEVCMLARQLPQAVFTIDESKTQAAETLAEIGMVDVVVVDDGFQHFGLARDLDIVTYDAALKKRVLHGFPFGVMREPLNALRRADIIVVTRAKFAEDITLLRERLGRISPEADVYQAGFHAVEIIGRESRHRVKYLEDKSVFLFAGVGNFRTLKQQVMALAGDLDEAMELSDHQRYDQTVLQHIKNRADRRGSDVILTTGKDWVKLGAFDFGREMYYLGLSVDLDPGEERLIENIVGRLDLRGRDGPQV
ncbi:MAG: tetraacyldisaccharide 4'-kinase [Candidatus Zixiibacteriota bacterium]|nr:MAG: tetraacyldisaccharide 4'-kinase [candidate division Zixibacteria bacterium]